MTEQTNDRAVLLSIDPEPAEQLLAGLKRYEFRRVAPTIDTPYTLFLYVTAPVKKVVGKTRAINEIDAVPSAVIDRTVGDVPSTRGELERYFEGTDEGHAIETAYHTPLDGPRRPTLVQHGMAPSQNFRYVDTAAMEAILDD